MSAIAVVGFGPGTIIEEPIGVLCSGCRQPVGLGQRGYLLRSQGVMDEAWHRSCARDRATERRQPQRDDEATLIGRTASGTAGSGGGT